MKVSRHLENNFPAATKEELEANSDDCAICWDRMDTARKLPCGHLFHKSCLHSWLEQVTNCPTCRTSLVPKQNTSSEENLLGQEARQTAQTTNHFFHFDGSRYVSWLPSFSVEVSHTSLLGERPLIIPSRPSQLDNMVNQVLQMFPHMTYSVIFEDLLTTHSVEQTVENILEERLRAPPTPIFPPTPVHRSTNLMNTSSFSATSFVNRGAHIQTTLPASFVGSSSRVLHLGESSSAQASAGPSSEASSSTSREEAVSPRVEGFRFSKNSNERENMLSHRKEQLVRKARLKYISRIGTATGESN